MNTTMRIRSPFHAILFACCLLGASRAAAQQTTAFTYQGQLRDGGTNANGTYGLTFKLFDAVTSGNQVGGTLTSSALMVNGLFSVNLDFGSAFDGGGRWLDITVQAGTNAPETLAPRVQVLPAPYALFATKAGTVTNGAIMNAHLAANAVNTTNIQNGAITTAQIAAGAVTNANLTANAIATGNIRDDAVTDAKISAVSGSKVTGTVANATNATFAFQALQLSSLFTVNTPFYQTLWEVRVPTLSDAGGAYSAGDLVVFQDSTPQMVIRGGGRGVGFYDNFIPNMNQFSGSGGTFVIPANVTRIMVEVWGAGGGGGNGFSSNGVTAIGGGGGGGAYCKGIFSVTPGTSYTANIGAGGAGSASSGGTGGTGGSSSFGGLLTASGGSGGGDSPNPAAGQGQYGSGGAGAGTGGGGAVNIARIGGGNGQAGGVGAAGGTAALGGPGGMGHGGGNGNSPGGGGGGADPNNVTRGGNGANGRVIVYY